MICRNVDFLAKEHTHTYRDRTHHYHLANTQNTEYTPTTLYSLSLSNAISINPPSNPSGSASSDSLLSALDRRLSPLASPPLTSVSLGSVTRYSPAVNLRISFAIGGAPDPPPESCTSNSMPEIVTPSQPNCTWKGTDWNADANSASEEEEPSFPFPFEEEASER